MSFVICIIANIVSVKNMSINSGHEAVVYNFLKLGELL